MRNQAKIMLLMSLLIFGCSEAEHSDSIELGIVSLSTPGNPEITHEQIRDELESWKIKFESDSIYVLIYSPDKDTSATEFTVEQKKLRNKSVIDFMCVNSDHTDHPRPI